VPKALDDFALEAVADIVHSHPPQRIEKMRNLMVFLFWRGLIMGAIAGALLCATAIAMLRRVGK
jgi:hypothetical protein